MSNLPSSINFRPITEDGRRNNAWRWTTYQALTASNRIIASSGQIATGKNSSTVPATECAIINSAASEREGFSVMDNEVNCTTLEKTTNRLYVLLSLLVFNL